MSTANKLLYLGETKSILKDTINMSNANITNSTTFRNYATQLKEGYIDILNNGTDTLYNNFTHLTGKGMTLSFAPTYQAPMKISCYGSTSQASTPTPSSPVDVVTTTGNQNVKVIGKNIFTGNFSQFDSTGGTGAAYGYFKLPDDNEIYTLTLIAKNNYTIPSNVYLGFTTNGGNANAGFSWVISQGMTVTAGEIKSYSTKNLRFISMYANNSTTLETIMNNFYVQLEKGTRTDYEAYNGTNYNIGLGNIELCKIGDYEDKIDKSTGKNYYDSSKLNHLAFATSGGSTVLSSSNNYIGYAFPCNEGEVYSISRLATTNSRFRVMFSSEEPNNDVAIFGGTGNINTYDSALKIENIVVPSGAKYMNVYLSNSGETIPPIMINKGTTATEYEPYGTDWYLKKNIGKVVLDGSETGWGSSLTRGYILNMSQTSPFNNKKLDVYLGYCDHFKYITNNNTWVELYGCGFNSGGVFWVREDNTLATSVEDFKTWLSTHNTIVYYVLATPTYTKITDSTLIEQLEAIKSKDNTTNITSSMVIGAIALKKE